MDNSLIDQELENIMLANNRIQSIVSKAFLKEMQDIKKKAIWKKNLVSISQARIRK